MKSKRIPNGAVIGLVGIEVLMGLASTTENLDPRITTLLLFLVLLIGSVLQASLLGINLDHYRRQNWRWKPGLAIQITLFLMIAWWAHKGLGNTIFVGFDEWQLILAGLGLGLLTMFGPEVINNVDDFTPEETPEKPQDAQEEDYGQQPYPTFLMPPQPQINGHSTDLHRAAAMLEH